MEKNIWTWKPLIHGGIRPFGINWRRWKRLERKHGKEMMALMGRRYDRALESAAQKLWSEPTSPNAFSVLFD